MALAVPGVTLLFGRWEFFVTVKFKALDPEPTTLTVKFAIVLWPDWLVAVTVTG